MEQDPSSLALLLATGEWEDFDGDGVADDPVNFQPKGDFHGYVYAPDSDITISANLHLMGGLAANTVTVESGAHLTFDQSLTTSDLAVAGLPLLVAWRTADIPDVPITNRSTTPAKYIAENGIVPVDSSRGAQEKYLAIKYYDTSGNPQSYVGLSAAFDWTQVGEVVSLMWDDDAAVGGEGQVAITPVTMTSKLTSTRETSGKVGE